jgi:hypothetical protein
MMIKFLDLSIKFKLIQNVAGDLYIYHGHIGENNVTGF